MKIMEKFQMRLVLTDWWGGFGGVDRNFYLQSQLF